MYGNNIYNTYGSPNNNGVKQVLLDALDKAMNKGIDLMGKNPNEDIYRVWEEYVKSTLDLTTQYGKMIGLSIMSDYLSFKLNIIGFSPFEKIKYTVERLMIYYRQIGMSNF